MKTYVVEMKVAGKWKFYSDHGTKSYAIDNADTIFSSRRIDIRIKEKGKVIFNLDDLIKLRKEKKK